MSIFITTYIFIYGLMNAYVLVRARMALGLGGRSTLWLAGLCAFMVLGPILVRLVEHFQFHMIAKALAYLSYTWFGLVFLFVSAGMALEVYRIAAIAFSSRGLWTPGSAAMLWIPLGISLSIFAYGLFEGANIKVERVNMSSQKMNPMRRKVRIAQISDVHVGLMTSSERISRMVEILKTEKPDIIVSTGDLLDGTTCDSDSLADIFRQLTPRYGMYAVLGNHEYYAGLDKSIEFTERAGFKVLRSAAVKMDSLPLNIAGADFPSRLTTGQSPDIKETELFSGLVDDNFNLLLKHVPYIEEASAPDQAGSEIYHDEGAKAPHFDLQLSGHTHKGQIFPFGLIVRMFYPRTAGLYYLDSGSWLYVSRGTGLWGPPIRVLSPPEITIIEIAPELQGQGGI